jgi:HEPN domain-containing protein
MNEEHKNYARTLLKKAEIDLLNAVILRDSGKGNAEGIGLHVQQAAEKSLKAILAFCNIHYTKTHSISGLVRLASDNHIKLPDAFVKADSYTDYAEDLRYDELDYSNEFDFNEAISIATECVAFAQAFIAEKT